MNLRDILIVITVLVIAAILIDGVRRMRKKKLIPGVPTVINKPLKKSAEDFFNPELPSGGARIKRREPPLESTVAAPVSVRLEQVDMFGEVGPVVGAESRAQGAALHRQPIAPEPVSAVAQKQSDSSAGESGKNTLPVPEEVIVLHVMGGPGQLSGRVLLQSVLASGMRYGEYNIFHRYESTAHDAEAIFSMANAVEPGIFDLDVMEEQVFVGVSFFLMLPGPKNSRQALDLMVQAARRVALEGGAEVHDQQHSVLTPQTVEHLRQQVMEYERRRLTQLRANH